MALTFGFYNSQSGDRKYDARQLSSIFDGILTPGVFRQIGTSLKVVSSSGMNVNVGIGRAWFSQTWTYNDAILPLSIDAADPILNRIDSVVLDIDTRTSVRTNSIIVVKGTPATTPVAPTLLESGEHTQHPIAHIYVGKGVTSILQANITDLVGTVDFPYINILDSETQIGDRLYSQDNYVTDYESVTESIDALDVGVAADISNLSTRVTNVESNKQDKTVGTASRALVTDVLGKIAASVITSIELGYLSGVRSNIQAQIDAILGTSLLSNRALISDANSKIAHSPVTATELGYLTGLTTNVQQQLDAKTSAITGAASTVVASNLSVNRVVISDANGKIAASTITTVLLGYLEGLTGNIQTQLNGKQATITGAATTIVGSNLSANRALLSDANGKVWQSTVTNVELGYLSGVTDGIQTQFAGKLGATDKAADSAKVDGRKVTIGTVQPVGAAVGDIWIDTN